MGVIDDRVPFEYDRSHSTMVGLVDWAYCWSECRNWKEVQRIWAKTRREEECLWPLPPGLVQVSNT